MRDEYLDPSGSTQQFRAFALADEPPPSRPLAPGLLVAGALLAVGVVAALGWFVLA